MLIPNIVMVALWENEKPISFKQLTKLLKLEAPPSRHWSSGLQSAGWWSGTAICRRAVVARELDRSRPRAAGPSRWVPGRSSDVWGSIKELETLQDVMTEVIQHSRFLTSVIGDVCYRGFFRQLSPSQHSGASGLAPCPLVIGKQEMAGRPVSPSWREAGDAWRLIKPTVVRLRRLLGSRWP